MVGFADALPTLLARRCPAAGQWNVATGETRGCAERLCIPPRQGRRVAVAATPAKNAARRVLAPSGSLTVQEFRGGSALLKGLVANQDFGFTQGFYTFVDARVPIIAVARVAQS